jgi:hypothetical protein
VANLKIFTSRKDADLPHLKSTDLEGAVDGALKLHDRMSELLKYPSNDSVTPLFNLHLNPSGVVVVALDGRLGLHETIRETDTFSELIQCGLGHTSLNTSFVYPLETKTGVHQLLGHLPIVGEDHKTR